MHTPTRGLSSRILAPVFLAVLLVTTPCLGAAPVAVPNTSDVTLPLEPPVGAADLQPVTTGDGGAGDGGAGDSETGVGRTMGGETTDGETTTDATAPGDAAAGGTVDGTVPGETTTDATTPGDAAADGTVAGETTTDATTRGDAAADGTVAGETTADVTVPADAAPSPTPPPPVPAGGSILSDPVARDKAVEAALRTFLGNPTGMTVTLVADEGGRSGSYEEISLRLTNSKVRGLSIASLWIRLTDCAVSLARLAASGTLQFTDPGKADLVGVVAEASMNTALAANSRALRIERPSLDFEPGFIRFRGRMNVPLFHRDVDVKGTLEISGGTKVMFRPRWMYVDSAKLPGFVMRALADKINPLADFSVFRFDVTLAALETTDDALLAATEGMRTEMERLRVLGLSAGAGTLEPLPPVTR